MLQSAPLLHLLAMFCLWAALLLLGVAHAWGPLSHQLFACFTVSPVNCTSPDGSLVLGAYAPDAIKPVQPALHSFAFGIFQLQRAFQQAAMQPILSTDAFDPVAYAHGYLVHLLQDFVGHHPGGFLNPAQDHPLEFAVDARSWKLRPAGFHLKSASPALATFVSGASGAYATAVNQSGLALGVDAVSHAFTKFGLVMDAEVVAATLDFTYEKDIFQYDVCHARDVAEALANLALARAWMQNAVAQYLTAATAADRVAGAVSAATAAVDAWFAANNGTNCVHGARTR